MAPCDTRYFSGANDVQLAATLYGSPTDRALLLLHGAGQTRHSWRNAGNTLAQAGWYSICLDTRGHGDSDWPDDGDYSIDTLIADVRAVVDRLTLESGRRPVLVGASLGGITALLAQGESLEILFESLVLVDITPRIDQTGVERIIGFMNRHQQGFASLEEAVDAVALYQSHRKKRKNKHDSGVDTNGADTRAGRGTDSDHSTGHGLKKNLRLAEDGRYYWHWDPRLMDHIKDFNKSNERIIERQQNAASRLTLPVLLVRGARSEIVSRESVEEFLQLVPHAKFVDVADAAHMVAGDNNDLFIQSVQDFLLQTIGTTDNWPG